MVKILIQFIQIKQLERSFSDVIYLYSSSIPMAESAYVGFGHTPLLPDNRFHNPAYALYRFLLFLLSILALYRIDINSTDLNMWIFTSISTGLEYFVLLIYSNLSVAISQLFTGSSSRDFKPFFQ